MLKILVLLLSLFVFAACGSEDGPTGDVVVGITSDFDAGSDLERLEVVMKADGEVLSEQTLALGSSAGKINFPAELAFEGVDDGAALEVRLDGFDADGVLRVVRSVRVTAKADERLLVRVHLEALCRRKLAMEEEDGIAGAPTCNDPTDTCIAGECQDSTGELEPYLDDWARSFGDACKPSDAGEPFIAVGQGQSDYFPAEGRRLCAGRGRSAGRSSHLDFGARAEPSAARHDHRGRR